jgi:hypothetical protein
MGLLKEFFSSVVMEQLLKDASFLNEATDFSEYVEAGFLNIPEAGSDPVVGEVGTLNANTLVTRVDTNLQVALKIAQSETTLIANAEKIQLNYNKVQSAVNGHSRGLIKYIARQASQAYAPPADTAFSPVFATSGALVSGRREIVEDDIIKLAAQFDIMAVDTEDRVIVLHDTHYNQLIKNSSTFKQQVAFKGVLGDLSAKIGKTFGGFKVYVYNDNPIYNASTGVKKAVGVAPAATDSISSFAFSKREVYKALGENKMFFTPDDPRAQGDIMNFQQAYMVSALRNSNKFTAAIFSANA